MSDLRELYQDVILDHGRNPRNHRALDGADFRAEGHNPLCGDRLTVYVKMKGDRIDEVSFEGAGCAISVASASMMTAALRGSTLDEARDKFRAFHDLLTCRLDADADESALGKLVVFSGVGRFPVRVKCATLAWHTLRAALEHRQDPVSTESTEGP
jgi:nitrogen fixation NifU-like protein